MFGTRLDAEAEVADLDVERMLVREEYVLGLDIAVNDVVRVHVVHGGRYLTEERLALVFAKSADVVYARVQLAVGRVLHANVEARRRVDHLVQAYEMRMVKLLHARYLAQQEALRLLV